MSLERDEMTMNKRERRANRAVADLGAAERNMRDASKRVRVSNNPIRKARKGGGVREERLGGRILEAAARC